MWRVVPLILLSALATGIAGCKQQTPARVHADLVELFPPAETSAETGSIDFGTLSAIPHLADGWSGSEDHNRHPFIWSEGPHSTLRFFLAKPRDLNLTIRCWPFRYPGAPQQIMTVTINGNPNGVLKFKSESRELRLHVPANRLRTGDNYIDFRYHHVRRPMDVLAGSRDLRRIAVAWDWMHIPGAFPCGKPSVRAGKKQIILPCNSAVSYSLDVPPDSVLTIDRIRALDANPVAQLKVLLQTVSEPTPREISFAMSDDPVAIPLGSQQLVRIDFIAAGSSSVELEKPAIRVEPVSKKSVTNPGRKPATVSTPNIILYLVDTLRADHLGCYGYSRPTSPHIDRFAAESVVFENAMAQSSWTRSAIASLFTSIYPQIHLVNATNEVLDDRFLTLAEILKQAGYQTAGFTANGNVNRQFGFHQGFDSYEAFPTDLKSPGLHALSDHVNNKAEAWLAGNRDHTRPFFLFLHTIDPHGPYAPKEPFRKSFARSSIPLKVGSVRMLHELNTNKIQPTPLLRQQLVDLYDAEIAFNDEHFGRLMEILKRENLYDSSLILIVSDHGEEFGDHGRWSHGINLFEEQLHVPLIIKLPESKAAGKRIANMVRQIDIAPTILELLGKDRPSIFQGASFLSMIEGTPEPVPGHSIAYLELSGRKLDSVRYGSRKMIRYFRYDRPRPRLELYNLQKDPREQTNVSLQEPVWKSYLFALLQETVMVWKPGAPAKTVEIDRELQEQLQALGYLNQ